MTESVEVVGPRLGATAGPLAGQHDAALLDLDGVVYIGPDVVPGAREALEAVRAEGLALRFVTNNASRRPETVAAHLTRLGVPAEPAEVVTSAQVAAALLAKRLPAGSGVLVIGADGLRAALTAEGMVPMDSVDDGPVAVVQGFGPDVGWRQLAEATRAVRSGLFWMATNLDRTVPTPHGAAPGNGSLIEVVAQAAGRRPDDVAGKPRPGAFRTAAALAGSSAPLVVGDRLDTDLEGARAARMPGLLVLTGVTGVTDLLTASAGERPDYVGRTLWSLCEEHPEAALLAPPENGAAVAGCRAARVRAVRDAGRTVVRVEDDGRDALDLLRAAAVAVWALCDREALMALNAQQLIQSILTVEPEARWAR
ncbi:MAG TPA: HAD-IIA family hydrolase [Kineosporiaceae bacterium]